MFLPETGAGAPQTDSVGSLLTPATLDISSGDIALMQKVLSAAARNPNLIPSDFMAYLVDYIQTSRLEVPAGQVFGLQKLTAVTGIIPASGTTPTAGTGFTYTHTNGTGIYVFTIPAGTFANPPIVHVTNAGGFQEPVSAVINVPTVTGFTVTIFTPSTDVKADGPFVFSALATN